MSDPAGTMGRTSNDGSSTCDVGSRQCPPAVGSTSAGSHDFPDLSDFVNQRTEDHLNKLFADRYTMADKLYAEVASGFPDPVIVCPWNKRPKRNFDHIGTQRRSWEEGGKRSVGSVWQSGWRKPSYGSFMPQESRKRLHSTTDLVRVFYPGKRKP